MVEVGEQGTDLLHQLLGSLRRCSALIIGGQLLVVLPPRPLLAAYGLALRLRVRGDAGEREREEVRAGLAR